jgi:hypothetical protein
MLLAAPGLRPIAILEEILRRHPEIGPGVRRTLERRIRHWRALNGAEQEVILRQQLLPITLLNCTASWPLRSCGSGKRRKKRSAIDRLGAFLAEILNGSLGLPNRLIKLAEVVGEGQLIAAPQDHGCNTATVYRISLVLPVKFRAAGRSRIG